MPRDAHFRWLEARLPVLVEAGPLSAEAAERLRAHVADDDDGDRTSPAAQEAPR